MVFKRLFLIVIVIGLVFTVSIFIIINNQRKKEVTNLANKVITSADYYIALKNLEGNKSSEYIEFNEGNILQINGTKPDNGYIKINDDLNYELKFYYAGYCVTQEVNDIDFNLTKESYSNCLEES